MLFLLLGGLTLLLAMVAMGAFSRAQVATIKSFGRWVAGIGGLLLAAMLLLTGRLPAGLLVLGLLGPLLLGWPRTTPAQKSQPRRPGPRGGAMTREEALAVLGLAPGADRAAIQAAYLRLMQAAHPDRGGSDWLAARINQARDVLLG